MPDKKKQLCVNLYGGPGCGKSTCAAYVFSRLKALGIKTELITEFAKDCVWENNQTAIANQCYVFGNQYYRMWRVKGMDVIITDSPLLLTSIYDTSLPEVKDALARLALAAYREFDNLDFFLRRVSPFEQEGRVQSEEESHRNDSRIKCLLCDCGIRAVTVDGNDEGFDRIVEIIRGRVGK